jgi:hypothetical protein
MKTWRVERSCRCVLCCGVLCCGGVVCVVVDPRTQTRTHAHAHTHSHLCSFIHTSRTRVHSITFHPFSRFIHPIDPFIHSFFHSFIHALIARFFVSYRAIVGGVELAFHPRKILVEGDEHHRLSCCLFVCLFVKNCEWARPSGVILFVCFDRLDWSIGMNRMSASTTSQLVFFGGGV